MSLSYKTSLRLSSGFPSKTYFRGGVKQEVDSLGCKGKALRLGQAGAGRKWELSKEGSR